MNFMHESNKEFMIPGGYPVHDKPITKDMLKESIIINGRPMTFKQYLLSRQDWLMEEVMEFHAGVKDESIIEMIDALTDLIYFIYGTAVSMGVDLDPFFKIVHENNMSKFFKCLNCNGLKRMSDQKLCPTCKGTGLNAVYLEDGKLTKPVDWKPPVLTVELERQRRAHG